MKNIAPSGRSRFPVKIIVVLLLDQDQVLAVYLNLSLSLFWWEIEESLRFLLTPKF